MARPLKGQIKVRQTTRGESFGVAFRLRGEPHYVHFGGSWEGWSLGRAEVERDFLIEKVNRGEWTPAPRTQPAPALAPPAAVPSFAAFSAEWLDRERRRLDDPTGKTARDLEWRLSVVMHAFGPLEVDAVTEALAEDLVDELRRERLEIEHARELGLPLTEEYTDVRTGRTHTRRRRGLANSSINKCLKTSMRVLEAARRRGHLVAVPDLASASLRAERPRRSFLQPAQIAVLLEAAASLERDAGGLTWEKVRAIRDSDRSAVVLARELGVSDVLVGKVRRGELWAGEPGPRNRNDIPRVAPIKALLLAGPRVDELCKLRGHHVDLAGRRIFIPRAATKTDAGERWVPLLPAAHAALVGLSADRPWGPQEPPFATRRGTPNTPSNVLKTIVAPARERANELLEARGQLPIAHLTPHTLRRTFASLLAVCGVHPRRAMQLLGHTDAKFTMSVYQQDLSLADGGTETLETALGCTLDEARIILEGRGINGTKAEPATKKAPPLFADEARID